MGPPFITAEWREAVDSFPEVTLRLQWGRRSSRRSCLEGQGPSLAQLQLASMGPPFITAEWSSARASVRRRVLASMGPPFITAEWLAGFCVRGSFGFDGFNGAAVHHGGVGMGGGKAYAIQHMLQWGRRSSRRSGPLQEEGRRRRRKLQWGRRSSRRSGPRRG